MFYWVLRTNPKDEIGPFATVLMTTWALILAGLTFIKSGKPLEHHYVLKWFLDISYPFTDAFACALIGAIVLGPKLRQLTPPWRLTLILLYGARDATHNQAVVIREALEELTE